MPSEKVIAANFDLLTAYGKGVSRCWDGLMKGETAVKKFDRFETGSFLSRKAALISGLDAHGKESGVIRMLSPMLKENLSAFPDDAYLILATTTGEIEYLEQDVLEKNDSAQQSCPELLLKKLEKMTGVNGPGMVMSAACASSTAAIARAASLIRSGEKDCVLVIACDFVSEFVFAGFSSLMALDSDTARPFDSARAGLSLGEASGFMLLMSEKRALKENRKITGEIAGWGMTSDANHMTGPSRDGSGLASAIRMALASADLSSKDIGSVSAHGTGTVYNDSMEMKAFKTIFGQRSIPVYSIKGGTGHTLGTAGLLDAEIAFETLRKQQVPPTVNLTNVDDEASGWVSHKPADFSGRYTVSSNSGFGGVNGVLVLGRYNANP